MIADDDEHDLAVPADQDPQLAVDLPGDFRQLAGELLGHNEIRGQATPVEQADPAALLRPKAVQIAVNPLDGYRTSTLNII